MKADQATNASKHLENLGVPSETTEHNLAPTDLSTSTSLDPTSVNNQAPTTPIDNVACLDLGLEHDLNLHRVPIASFVKAVLSGELDQDDLFRCPADYDSVERSELRDQRRRARNARNPNFSLYYKKTKGFKEGSPPPPLPVVLEEGTRTKAKARREEEERLEKERKMIERRARKLEREERRVRRQLYHAEESAYACPADDDGDGLPFFSDGFIASLNETEPATSSPSLVSDLVDPRSPTPWLIPRPLTVPHHSGQNAPLGRRRSASIDLKLGAKSIGPGHSHCQVKKLVRSGTVRDLGSQELL